MHKYNLRDMCREAGIDLDSVGSEEEAIDILRSAEVNLLLDEDCAVCECPEEGLLAFQEGVHGYDVYYCNHRCRAAMPEHIADEGLGLEDSYLYEGK